MGTWVVGIILLGMVFVIVRGMIRDKRNKKSTCCGGNCKYCGGGCH